MAVETKFTGDEGDLVRANERVALSAAKIDTAYREGVREAQRLERASVQAYERALTPQQRYERSVRLINQAVANQKITQETANRAIRQAKREMEEAENAKNSLLSPNAITGMATRFLSVAAAIGTVRQAIEQANEVANNAAQRSQESLPGLGELAQLADTGGRLKDLRKAADTVFGAGATATRGEAGQVVFQAVSTGNEDQLPFFQSLAAAKIFGDQTAQAIASAAKVQGAFGEDQTGTVRDILSKTLVAASTAIGTAQEVATATASAGGAGAAVGFSLEEVAAAIAVGSNVFRSPDVAGTRAEALFRELEKQPELLRDTLVDTVRAIEEKLTATGDTTIGLLNSSEAAGGFRALATNLEQLASTIAATANAGDAVGNRTALALNNREVAAAVNQQATANRVELETNFGGIRRNETLAVINEARRVSGDDLLTNLKAGLALRLGGGPEDTAAFLGVNRAPNAAAQLIEALGKNTEALGKLDIPRGRAAGRPPAPPVPALPQEN